MSTVEEICQVTQEQYYNLTSGYFAIPENLIFNVLLTTVCVAVFLVVRIKVPDQITPPGCVKEQISLFSFVQPESAPVKRIMMGIPAIIIKLLTMSVSDIRKKAGYNAAHYMIFQLHLLSYSLLCTVVYICVYLPINLSGTFYHETKNDFVNIILTNLGHSLHLTWIYIAISAVMTLIGIFVMTHFIYQTGASAHKSLRTIMIKNVRRDWCDEDIMYNLIGQSVPHVGIKDVTIGYNSRELLKSVAERQRNQEFLDACLILERQEKDHVMVYKHTCGYTCKSFCCGQCSTSFEVREAKTRYEMLDKELELKVICNGEKATKNPTGIVFVTLTDKDNMNRALMKLTHWKDLSVVCNAASEQISDFSPAEILAEIKRWSCRIAPLRENIQWENVKMRSWFWYLRLFICVACILYFSLILSIPSSIFGMWRGQVYSLNITSSKAFKDRIQIILVNTIPPLVLDVTSSVLPDLISHIANLFRLLTRTAETRYSMSLEICFLLITVILIPSVGGKGLDGLMDFLFTLLGLKTTSKVQSRTNNTTAKFWDKIMWECMFTPEINAFYSNFLVTLAFMNQMTCLLRIPELISIGINMMLCKSKVERMAVCKLERRQIKYDYATVVVGFAVIMMYGLLCPLVGACGVIFMLSKHLVDRYNIYFVCKPVVPIEPAHIYGYHAVMIALQLPGIALLLFLYLFHIIHGQTGVDVRLIAQAVSVGVSMIVSLITVCLGPKRFYQYTMQRPVDWLYEQLCRPMGHTIRHALRIPKSEHELSNRASTWPTDLVLKQERYYPDYLMPFIKTSQFRETVGPNEIESGQISYL